MSAAPAKFVLVTGMSGAGKTSAFKILEDLGYEAVDNLPLSMLRTLADLRSADATQAGALAVGIDSRTRDFKPDAALEVLNHLRGNGQFSVSLLYLDCEDAVLQSRFTATRRRHPLASDRPVADGIRHERALLWPLKQAADLVLDTSELSLPELRRLIGSHFGLATGPDLMLAVTSFSYRLGLPREADLVFDVRFLHNPHYQAALRPHTGENEAVGAFILQDPAYQPFIQQVRTMLLSLLPSYRREGKNYLTIAIGCTGGKHRSVYVARQLAQMLEAEGHPVVLQHRDMLRGES